jgi:hypothetical protein
VTFEVPVSAVSRSRTPRGVFVVAAVSAAIVLGAAVAAFAAPSPTSLSAAAAAHASPPAASLPPALAALIGAAPTPPFEPASFNRPLPTQIDCHRVTADQCHRLVRAALRILPDELPKVGRAEAWGSLVCNDNFDCPADYLRDANPAGSVLVAFVDGSPAVTVNVVDWGYGTAVRLGLRAWLIPTS